MLTFPWFLKKVAAGLTVFGPSAMVARIFWNYSSVVDSCFLVSLEYSVVEVSLVLALDFSKKPK